MVTPPILDNKRASSKSLFTPAALLREARRQKGLADVPAPSVCIFDPDGDLARRLRQTGASKPFAPWPCYHTDLDVFELGGRRVGIVGRVVGASFAILVAEELFASGCRLLVSLTSAGQITPSGPPPYFVVIDRALRDEGASYHYAPPSEFADADPSLVTIAAAALAGIKPRCVVGASWTTDAPFRETAEAIEAARSKGILAVEMEAAASTRSPALRAFASSASRTSPIRWGLAGDDFEKGEAEGTRDALAVLEATIAALARS